MRVPILSLAALCAVPLLALDVRNLDDASHLAGPTLAEKDLEGKVVVVEEWGWQCGPCRASLPHIAELAKEIAKDGRGVLIGAHVQSRNESAIRDLLREAGCEYPVYQAFRVAGAPSASGIPFAYVVDHKGEVVWSGHPAQKAFDEAVRDALKAVPKPVPGSLISGMDVRYAKEMPRRLRIGQNVEGALNQLRSRARIAGPAAEEANAILARCDAWYAETEAAIRTAQEEGRPSEALFLGQRLLRTFPSRAAALRTTLAAIAKDPVTQNLARSRQALDALQASPRSSSNARKMALSRANLQMRQLDVLLAKGDNPDASQLRAAWEAFAKTLAE